MNARPRGLYEVLITEAIASQLRDLGDNLLPMAITWRLVHSLPGDLFAQFAAAVA